MVILGSGNYVKASEVQNGDMITFKDEGEWVENARYHYEDGTPKQDFVIGVEIKGQEKKMRLSKTNRDILVEAYDSDTAEWVGKTALITVEKVLVAGKKCDMIVLQPNTTVVEQPDAAPEEDPVTPEEEQKEIPF